jgi:hypothetical protein
MKFNLTQLAKVLGQLVLAAPAIISAIKPIAKTLKGAKPVVPVADAAPAQAPPST